jgi:dihydrofolate reductase
MRKVIAFEWMSLDGVIQAPAYPGEDRSGGFTHGGWHLRYFEAESMKWVVDNITQAGGYLLGRRTYEMFASHWPNASAEEQALAIPLNTLPKYVASRTLKKPLSWGNSRLLGADVVAEVRTLQGEDGKDLLAIGSAELVRDLIAHSVVDELRLMIDPVCLGGGKRFFPENGALLPLRLVESRTVSNGALLATYSRVTS